MSQKHQRTAALAKATHSMQEGQARSLDALAEFETFREMFAPEIRKDLARGLTSEAILKKYKPLAAARLAQVAIAGSEKSVVGAARELFDRTDGKPAQKVEHTHKLGQLSDEELDALLTSQALELNTLETQPVSVTDVTDDEDSEQS